VTQGKLSQLKLQCISCVNGVPLLRGVWYFLVIVPHGMEVQKSVDADVKYREMR
jgi:hypothetical protein